VIGLDTNVLLRVLVDDGDPQTVQARNYLAAECSAANPAFINAVVLADAVWVLTRSYAYGKAQIIQTLDGLLAARAIVFDDQDLVRSALKAYAGSSMGFTDALIGERNRAAGCAATATFDRKAARLTGFALVR